MGLGGSLWVWGGPYGALQGRGGSLWVWGGRYGSGGVPMGPGAAGAPPHAPEKHSVNSCSSLVARSRAFRACSSVTRLLISLGGDGGASGPAHRH